MAEMREGPIPNSFWVRPDRLLAGKYPGHVRAVPVGESLPSDRECGEMGSPNGHAWCLPPPFD